MLTFGYLGDGKFLHEPMPVGWHIAGCEGMVDGFWLWGTGARLTVFRRLVLFSDYFGNGASVGLAPGASGDRAVFMIIER